MKNIIWQMENGHLAVTSILDDSLDSKEFAAKLKQNGDLPANFTAVLFDVPALPSEDAQFWKLEAGRITVDTASALAVAKSQAWERIKAERDRRKEGGVKVGAKWFHSDDGSRIQQMGHVIMGASLPVDLQWKTMDGSFITMTPALAQQVFAAVAASDQAIFAVAEQHRVAMEASADPASYDYSGGWPKIYGE